MDIFIFIAAGTLALIGTLVAVVARHIFYAALGLAAALVGTAGLFVPLNGELIAVIQLLVYVGAVATAIVFVLMLSPPYYLQRAQRNAWKMAAAAFVAVLFVTPLYLAVRAVPKLVPAPIAPMDMVVRIGHALLSEFVFPFEIISLVLTVTIIGAIVLARELPGDESAREGDSSLQRKEAEPR